MNTILFTLLALLTVFLISLLWLGLVPRQLKKTGRVAKSIALSILLGLGSNEYIQHYQKKHDKLVRWLGRRLTKKNFNGLTLTILCLIFFWALLQLAGVTEAFATNDTIVLIDERFDKLMLFFRQAGAVRFFLFTTALGSLPVVLVILSGFSYYIWLNRQRLFIAPLWLTYLGAGLANILGKLALHRARPPFPVYAENNYSFPSGHATTAVAVYGFLIYFIWRHAQNKYYKFFSLVGGCLIIFLIGFSRLYLGVHYLSDVWAGALLGLLWLIAGISWAEWRKSRAKKITTANRHLKRQKKSIVTICVISVLCIAALFRPVLLLPNQNKPAGQLKDLFGLATDFGLERFTQTLSAKDQEPLSLIIAAYPDKFVSDFQATGWQLADKISWPSSGKMIAAAIYNSSYPQAPMTPSFWQGNPQDYGFEKSTIKESARQRYHARFWQTNLVTPDGKTIYVGTASYDTGLKWGVTHRISPDIDNERERLFNNLNQAGLVVSFHKMPLVAPILGKNFSGDQFFTDGQAYLIELK